MQDKKYLAVYLAIIVENKSGFETFTSLTLGLPFFLSNF